MGLEPDTAGTVSVTGTYSDGSTKPLAASGEVFASSNTAVATVSAAGVVTAQCVVPTGATATITATDSASGLTTAAASATQVSVGSTLTLCSIALQPLTLSLAPQGTAQLTVMGTYSDGSTDALPAAAETFSSSNGAVASVAADGLVTISATAPLGGSAAISATDRNTNLATGAANSTQITVIAASSGGPPTATSASAAATTAQSNPQCTVIQPFYWEIGNASSALASGSPTPGGASVVTASSRFSIASASKWIYGMYVVQQRGTAANLTSSDIQFLTFQSGYTYMGSDTSGATCTAPSSGADSINHCLTLPSTTTPGEYMDSLNTATVGVFDYDGGHEENHAGQFQPEINALDTAQLGSTIAAGLGITGITLRYTQPLLAGGIYASAADYIPMLRAVLSGQLAMLGALGTNAVCAWSIGTGCNAASSPINTQHWHYSIAHWVEDDPTNGDGAFSSPGAFGFYPWIEANKRYYGIISRYVAATGVIQNGLQSALCGHEIRAAWDSGQPQ